MKEDLFEITNVAAKDNDFDICGTQYTPAAGKFRISNNRLLLTYRSKIPKAEYKVWLQSLTPNTIKVVEIAHEVGNSKGVDYEHSHVLIDFGGIFTTTSARKFDYNGIHPNIKKVTSNLHWTRSLNYLAKEDPENAHLKTEPTLAQFCWDQTNVHDAIRNIVKKPSDVQGIITLFGMKPQDNYIVERPTFGWVDHPIAILESEIRDRRRIHWYVGKADIGKTWLIKHMVTKDPTRYWWCNSVGGGYHFNNNFANAVKNGWNKRACLFNLSMDSEFKSIYGPLEDLKDGIITSQKYQGGSWVFDNPTIVVMANFPPCLDKMDNKRWIVYKIADDKNTVDVVFDLLKGINNIDSLPKKEREMPTDGSLF